MGGIRIDLVMFDPNNADHRAVLMPDDGCTPPAGQICIDGCRYTAPRGYTSGHQITNYYGYWKYECRNGQLEPLTEEGRLGPMSAANLVHELGHSLNNSSGFGGILTSMENFISQAEDPSLLQAINDALNSSDCGRISDQNLLRETQADLIYNLAMCPEALEILLSDPQFESIQRILRAAIRNSIVYHMPIETYAENVLQLDMEVTSLDPISAQTPSGSVNGVKVRSAPSTSSSTYEGLEEGQVNLIVLGQAEETHDGHIWLYIGIPVGNYFRYGWVAYDAFTTWNDSIDLESLPVIMEDPHFNELSS